MKSGSSGLSGEKKIQHSFQRKSVVPPLLLNNLTMIALQRSLAVFAITQMFHLVYGSTEGNLQMLRSVASRLPRILSFSAVDTTETVYADEAQAWRMLGLYMDCQPQADDGTSVCERYLLWAAYVDEDYTGKGQGEYMFYNAESGEWDDSSCEMAGSERCVKMDCHLRSTHFKVLGYYKQYGVSSFFEQLFAHQGSCTWSEYSYTFMENNRQLWPEECTLSGVTDEEGTSVYYDIKPLPGGKMTIGLYTDAVCSTTYTGSLTVEEAVQSNNADGYYDEYAVGPEYGSDEWFDEWNDALSTYRTCQPCVVSSLSNSATGRRLEEGNNAEDGGDEDQNNDNGEEAENNGGGMFGCQDAAGYQGANQCALFAMNTDIGVASFRDVRLATLQGTITRAYGAGVTSSPAQKWWRDWGFFTVSLVIFFIGLLMFCCCVKVKRRTFNPSAKEPLLGNSRNSSSSSSSNRSSKSAKSSKSNNRK